MRLIFCCDPSDRRKPDEAYQAEAVTAERLGLEYALFNFEALVHENDPAKAVRRVPEQSSLASAVYRGWMLTDW